MNQKNKLVRAMLSEMSKDRAREMVKAFHLPEDEEAAIMAREVDGKMYPKICDELHMTPETLKRTRRRAFIRIVDALEHLKTGCN